MSGPRITDEAANAAARVFYGGAYGSVGDEANKLLLNGAREALEAALPHLAPHLPNRHGETVEVDLDAIESDAPQPVDRETPGVERLLAEQAERIAKAIESEAIGEEGDPAYTNRRGTLGIAAEIARRFKP